MNPDEVILTPEEEAAAAALKLAAEVDGATDADVSAEEATEATEASVEVAAE